MRFMTQTANALLVANKSSKLRDIQDLQVVARRHAPLDLSIDLVRRRGTPVMSERM